MPFEADRDVPALIVKFGDYPLHHGGVGAIRSLGRLGVPMYAITEDRYTPAAASRYLTRAFVWPTTGTEDPDRLIEGLIRIGRRIGRPAVLVPTDEEAAVLIAEHQSDLLGRFLFPRVEPGLPRRLASKQGLHELCVEHGIPSPTAAFPQSYDDIVEFAELDEFMDMPMRTYSSGMYGRLGFSVAVTMQPDILLIDEALSVGDARFRKKSAQRMQELCGGGRTIVLVSHALGTIQDMSDSAIWMHRGELLKQGEPDEVIAAYTEFLEVGEDALTMEDM